MKTTWNGEFKHPLQCSTDSMIHRVQMSARHQYVCVSYLIHQTLPITFASSGWIHFRSENILLKKRLITKTVTSWASIATRMTRLHVSGFINITYIISGWDDGQPQRDAVWVTATKAKYKMFNLPSYVQLYDYNKHVASSKTINCCC